MDLDRNLTPYPRVGLQEKAGRVWVWYDLRQPGQRKKQVTVPQACYIWGLEKGRKGNPRGDKTSAIRNLQAELKCFVLLLAAEHTKQCSFKDFKVSWAERRMNVLCWLCRIKVKRKMYIYLRGAQEIPLTFINKWRAQRQHIFQTYNEVGTCKSKGLPLTQSKIYHIFKSKEQGGWPLKLKH